MSTASEAPPRQDPEKRTPGNPGKPPDTRPPTRDAPPPPRKTAVYDDVAEVRRRMAGNPRARFGRWFDYALGAAVPLVVVVLLLDGGRWAA